jgi:hypothetical protein
MRTTVALLSTALLSGCVVTAPLSEQVPVPSYTLTSAVVVSVVDERERTREGGSPNDIGRVHGVYGIPTTWRVHPAISVEEGDRERTAAQWLQNRLARGLEDSGWSVSEASLAMDVTTEQMQDALSAAPGAALLLLRLKEWWFSMNLNWVSAYTFTNDVEVSVFRQGEGVVLAKRFDVKDIIDEQASESPRNNILRMYSSKLTEYLDDAEVRAALEQRGGN